MDDNRHEVETTMDGQTRHTQPPCVDIAVVIPELAPLARITVRLHPRQGEMPVDGSKIGGLFLWPSQQEWPRCNEHDCPLVAVLQLRKQDVPELGFPEGADLFQLLWCPNYHESTFGPIPQVFWRRACEVTTTLRSHPIPTVTDAVGCPEPTPCRLFPERVVEYSHAFELHDNNPELWSLITNSRVLQERAQENDAIFEDAGTLYQYCLSVADGTKVGGYVNWRQSPEIPVCTCGAAMEHLLTVADSEFDGGTWQRWLAQEERGVWNGPPEERFRVQWAGNFTHGSYIFICRNCEGWPVRAIFQCD